MRLRVSLVFLVSVTFLVITCGLNHAQEAASSTLSEILSRMEQAKSLSAEETAFSDLMNHVLSDAQNSSNVLASFISRHPAQADQIKLSLIRLLTREDSRFINGPGTYTEEDGEFYAALITGVASLDDVRAIPALVGAMTTGGIARRGLMKYGDKALDAVMTELKSGDALVRATALDITISLLKRHDNEDSRARIKGLVQSALSDPDLVVRGRAVSIIECLDDRQEFLSTLQQISKTDPEKLPGKALDGGDGDAFYPVRYDARRVLRNIQNGKTCNP